MKIPFWIATGERHVREQQRNNTFISLLKCCIVNKDTRARTDLDTRIIRWRYQNTQSFLLKMVQRDGKLRQIRCLCHTALLQLFLHTSGIQNANSLTFLCLCLFLLSLNPSFFITTYCYKCTRPAYEDVTSRVFAARPWPPTVRFAVECTHNCPQPQQT